MPGRIMKQTDLELESQQESLTNRKQFLFFFTVCSVLHFPGSKNSHSRWSDIYLIGSCTTKFCDML